MATHNDTGDAGEKIAVSFLKKKGFRILKTNWRIEKWEIDIIAEDKKERVFVEVKTRFSHEFGDPAEAVTPQKQKHLINAANLYVLQEDYEGPLRFDIISIFLQKGSLPEIKHIEDAFY